MGGSGGGGWRGGFGWLLFVVFGLLSCRPSEHGSDFANMVCVFVELRVISEKGALIYCYSLGKLVISFFLSSSVMSDYVSVIEELQCAFIIGTSLDLFKHA